MTSILTHSVVYIVAITLLMSMQAARLRTAFWPLLVTLGYLLYAIVDTLGLSNPSDMTTAGSVSPVAALIIIAVTVAIFSATVKSLGSEHFLPIQMLFISIVYTFQVLIFTESTLAKIVAVELLSILGYILVAMQSVQKSNISAYKYMLLSMASSGFFLFGYSLYPSTYASGIASTDGATSNYALFQFLVLIGLCFRLTAFPLHYYAADVYESIKPGALIVVSIIPKFAGLYMVYHLLVIPYAGQLGTASNLLVPLLTMLSILSLFIGNLFAVAQNNVPRLLAFSTVVHAGFILAAVSASMTVESINTDIKQASVGIFYLFAYLLGIAPFLLLTTRYLALNEQSRDDSDETTDTGMGIKVLQLICVLSMLGMPLTAGFVAKLLVFTSVIQQMSHAAYLGLGPVLLVSLVVAAGLSCFYYYRLATTVLTQRLTGELKWWEVLLGLTLTVASVVVGCYPALVLGYLNS